MGKKKQDKDIIDLLIEGGEYQSMMLATLCFILGGLFGFIFGLVLILI